MSALPELQALMTGLVFGEQPRWHEDRLWFSDWGTQEVIAVDLEGNSEVVLQGPSFAGNLMAPWLHMPTSPPRLLPQPGTSSSWTVAATPTSTAAALT